MDERVYLDVHACFAGSLRKVFRPGHTVVASVRVDAHFRRQTPVQRLTLVNVCENSINNDSKLCARTKRNRFKKFSSVFCCI